jgi:hypothetical protein
MGEGTKYKDRIRWMRKPLEDWLLKQKKSPPLSRQVLQGYIVGNPADGEGEGNGGDGRCSGYKTPYLPKVNTMGKLPGYKPRCYGS